MPKLINQSNVLIFKHYDQIYCFQCLKVPYSLVTVLNMQTLNVGSVKEICFSLCHRLLRFETILDPFKT